MHLPIELTALSCSMTTFSLVIFIEIVNIAVKIQWKITHEAGRGLDATTCQQEHCLQLVTAE